MLAEVTGLPAKGPGTVPAGMGNHRTKKMQSLDRCRAGQGGTWKSSGGACRQLQGAGAGCEERVSSQGCCMECGGPESGLCRSVRRCDLRDATVDEHEHAIVQDLSLAAMDEALPSALHRQGS